MSDDETLVLGPLLRFTDESSATVWVETAGPAQVSVRWGGSVAHGRTFAVHGHHYALVPVSGLPTGEAVPYTVEVDGETVWPPADSPFPAPVIRTLDPGRAPKVLFGSCRTAVGHDADGTGTHGVDALRSYALRLAEGAPPSDQSPDLGDATRLWPDVVLFLGDQVYADETTPEMRDFIEARRDPQDPPGYELRDYEEYAYLYRLAWSDPTVRWFLSTVPSGMIFDDHDIRDDWNTSRSWKSQMEATTWWHDRIVAGLASYWVYQHLGNLTADERSQDEIWCRVEQATHEHPVDLTEVLDAFAARADQQPETYRWSYARELPRGVRLVVVDSRAARVLDPEHRAMLDPGETAWLEGQLTGDVQHLLVATSIPFLLARGLHHVETFSEALAGGAWGRAGARLGEWARQAVDLEHWPAFHRSFQQVARSTLEVASGERGSAPATVTFLSGDVHHSYVSQAWESGDPGKGAALESKVLQVVCSPMRNPLPRAMRFATAFSSYGVAGPLGRLLATSAKVPDGPLRWRYAKGPWFDNNIALIELAGRTVRLRWLTADVEGDDYEHPRLRTVNEFWA